MEKTLSMGAFTELDEREVMETEGGFLQGFFDLICGATAAEKEAERVYDRARQGVIDTLKNTKTPLSTLSESTRNMWDLNNIVDPDIVL